MISFPTFDDFRQHARTILVPIERRRKRYLLYFVLCTTLALFIASLTIPGYIKGALGIFSITFLFFYLVLAPLSGYRKRVKQFGGYRFGQGGLKQPYRLEYSLKHDLYTGLLSAFGDFKFVSSGNIPLVLLGKSCILPPFDRVIAEDYIVGVLNDMTIKMTEASLVRVREGGKLSFFKGLLILIDVSESRVKLRRHFSGHTVLAQHDNGYIKQQFLKTTGKTPQSWTPMSGLECYTDVPEESHQLLQADLVKPLSDIYEIIRHLKRQTEHIDTKIFYSLNVLYDLVKSQLIDRFAHNPLPAEQAYDKEFGEKGIDFTKGDPISEDVSAANNGFRAEFFEDKILISLPYSHDLFEPNSIFESPLNEEDIRLVYALMDVLQKITERVDEAVCKG